MSATTTSAPTSGARALDRGTAPERFARGWHCLGPVDQFGDGEAHPGQAFGGKLVVWAAQDGTLNLLDGEHHTSIQWHVDSLSQCAKFPKMEGEPGGRHVSASCPRLASSIERAVAEPEIGVLDGY